MTEIEHRLIKGTDWVVIPKSAMTIPIAMPVFLKEDGSHYTLQEVCDAVGSLLVPIAVKGGNHVMVRFAFKKNGEEQMFREFIEGLGLINMRVTDSKYDMNIEDIDWNSIQPNHYGLFGYSEMPDIPRHEDAEEII